MPLAISPFFLFSLFLWEPRLNNIHRFAAAFRWSWHPKKGEKRGTYKSVIDRVAVSFFFIFWTGPLTPYQLLSRENEMKKESKTDSRDWTCQERRMVHHSLSWVPISGLAGPSATRHTHVYTRPSVLCFFVVVCIHMCVNGPPVPSLSLFTLGRATKWSQRERWLVSPAKVKDREGRNACDPHKFINDWRLVLFCLCASHWICGAHRVSFVSSLISCARRSRLTAPLTYAWPQGYEGETKRMAVHFLSSNSWSTISLLSFICGGPWGRKKDRKQPPILLESITGQTIKDKNRETDVWPVDGFKEWRKCFLLTAILLFFFLQFMGRHSHKTNVKKLNVAPINWIRKRKERLRMHCPAFHI